jgi:hypothetical protein
MTPYAAPVSGLVPMSPTVSGWEIFRPDYTPEGEFRVQDPDGYAIRVARTGAETP